MPPDPPSQTEPYLPAPAAARPASARRPAVVTAAEPDAGAELLRLTRSRLRQVFVLFLACYLAFVARDLTRDADKDPIRTQRWLLAAAAGLQAGLVAGSRTRWFRGWARVRAAEWANLVLFAGAMGANQYTALAAPAGDRDPPADWSGDFPVLVANTWLLPWVALAAGYPVIVPNPARRALGLAVLMAAAPAAVTGLAAAANPALPPEATARMAAQYAIWGGVAVGVAGYGARQAELLRREAFEARRFGRYRLVRKLGQGGMGEVHLAEHSLLRRPSVIKLIRPDRATDPKLVRRFEREVRLLATLTHWNTVEVFDYGHTPDGTFFYVMEYLPGPDLEELVEAHGPLPPGRAVYLLRQVCRGLREAHEAGLVHRDVKPGNVIVCRRGGLPDVAKLLDFGLVQDPAGDGAGADARLTREGYVLGTPAYLSPEQACGRPLDPRTDVYSLGATAYFLVTGAPPFVKPGAVETIAAHVGEPVVPASHARPGVPLDLCRVISRCLDKDPAARFPGVKELEAALAGCGCAADWDESKAAAWWAEHRPAG